MKSVFLVGFFKFDKRGQNYGFERMHLQTIWKTAEEAREKMSFCDEAGWYEGAVIEERQFGHEWPKSKNRIWLMMQEDGSMKQVDEPEGYGSIAFIV